MSQDLLNFENQLKSLAEAKDEKAFKQQFKIMYGMDYDDAKVREWLANPTGGNYKRAFGTENDMARRVAVYNKSQQRGAKVVKGAVVTAAAAAVIVATGGTAAVVMGPGAAAAAAASGGMLLCGGTVAVNATALATTGAVVGGTVFATRSAVELTDRATNNVDNKKDLSGAEVGKVVTDAAKEGAVAGATAVAFEFIGAGITAARGATTTAKTTANATQSAAKTTPTTGTASERSASEIVKDAGKGVERVVVDLVDKKTGMPMQIVTDVDVQAGKTSKAVVDLLDSSGKPIQIVTEVDGTGSLLSNLAKQVSKGPVNLTASEFDLLETALGIQKGTLKNMSKDQILKMIKHTNKRPNLNPEYAKDVLTILNKYFSSMT